MPNFGPTDRPNRVGRKREVTEIECPSAWTNLEYTGLLSYPHSGNWILAPTISPNRQLHRGRQSTISAVSLPSAPAGIALLSALTGRREGEYSRNFRVPQRFWLVGFSLGPEANILGIPEHHGRAHDCCRHFQTKLNRRVPLLPTVRQRDS